MVCMFTITRRLDATSKPYAKNAIASATYTRADATLIKSYHRMLQRVRAPIVKGSSMTMKLNCVCAGGGGGVNYSEI